MASDSEEFKHESLQDSGSVVKYIDAISQGLRSGKFVLGNDGDRMVLEPSGLLKLDLKAKRKDGKIKLAFKLTWRENGVEEKSEPETLVIEAEKAARKI